MCYRSNLFCWTGPSKEVNKWYKTDSIDIFEDAINGGFFKEELSDKDSEVPTSDAANAKTKESSNNKDDDDNDNSEGSGSSGTQDNESLDNIDEPYTNSFNKRYLLIDIIISFINCIFGNDDDHHNNHPL